MIIFSYQWSVFTDKMDWELKDETKMIDGYQVQKATTKFGGRQWNTWFCADIPFFEEPYKLDY